MTTGFSRGAAIALLCAMTTLLGGCSGNGGSDPVWAPGQWYGSLTLSYLGGGESFGSLTLTLDQQDDFVTGAAEWTAATDTLSISGPVDGSDVTLRLSFRCLDPDAKLLRPVETVLTASVDAKTETLTISGGSGLACPLGGEAINVTAAAATLTRL